MLQRISRGITREWLWGFTLFGLIISPFGCQLQQSGEDDAVNSDPNRAGLFINDNAGDPLLIFGRATPGAFFVFGTRSAGGGLEEIESIVLRGSDGKESFITFSSGRPEHIQGTDGSYAHVTYNEVSAQRITATIEIFDAATAQQQDFSVDIDVQQTAAQIAALVTQLTGQKLEAPSTAGAATTKLDHRAVRITVFSPLFSLFIAPLAAILTLSTIVLGQILASIYAAVVASLQAVVLVIFSPLFLLTELFSETVVNIEFVPFFDLLANPPSQPNVVLN